MGKLNSRADLIALREECVKAFEAEKTKILVCGGTGCVAGGSLDIYARLKELLEERGIFVVRYGDDLMIDGKKLSVSIATKSTTSILIHTGLNILSEGAPVKASGLTSELGITDIKEFALEVMKRYSEELEDINLASTKVRGV